MNTTASRSIALILLGFCLMAWTSSCQAFEPDIIIDSNTNATDTYPPLNNLVVELSASGGASWGAEGSTTNAFRGASKVCTVNSGSAYFCVHTYLPNSGPYQVFIWHNGSSSHYTSTAIVTHDAVTTNVTYSQMSNSGQWILLGTYWFSASQLAEVKVSNSNQYGKLSADAVRFSPATADVVLDSTSNTGGVTFSPGSSDWTSVSDLSGYGGHIRRSNSVASGASVSFQPTIPVEGDYDISIWLPPNTGAWLPGGSAASTFDVDVYVRGGSSSTVTVTMPGTGTNEGRWVRIGTSSYRLGTTAPAGKVVVKANGSASYYVPADAIRWSKVGAPGIVMDEDDGSPEVVADIGTWTNVITQQNSQVFSNYNTLRYGVGYKHAYFASTSSTERGMTYKPAIPALGLYDIYLWFPNHTGMASNNNAATKLEVHTALGTTVTTAVNQQLGTGSWKHAGRYILNPESAPTDPPTLRLSTPAAPGGGNWTPVTGYVLADGVMFLRDNENKDTDSDGLPDWYEELFSTLSSDADSDGDGMTDVWEVAHGLNPLIDDSAGDPDGDGWTNLQEYLRGGDPQVDFTLGQAADVGLLIYTPAP